MSWQLIAQNETRADEIGRHYGAELFRDDEGNYSARLHIRTYDGIKVDSSWCSDRVAIEAADDTEAHRAVSIMLRAFAGGLGASAVKA